MRLLLAVCILLGGCAADRQSEDYGVTSADLTLTPQNHPHGWARQECFGCHIPANLHLVNRLNHPSFSSARDLVEQYGIQSCRGCHSTNGVP